VGSLNLHSALVAQNEDAESIPSAMSASKQEKDLCSDFDPSDRGHVVYKTYAEAILLRDKLFTSSDEEPCGDDYEPSSQTNSDTEYAGVKARRLSDRDENEQCYYIYKTNNEAIKLQDKDFESSDAESSDDDYEPSSHTDSDTEYAEDMSDDALGHLGNPSRMESTVP
jgi:hypothetical protein